MQNHSILPHQLKIEDHIRELLRHFGLSEEEIRLADLKKMSNQILKSLLESYRKKDSRITELTPLNVIRSRGGISIQLEGVKEGKIPFHGAQDKALYLFFWKHSREALTSSQFLMAKEKDPRIRKSLLEIYKAIRGHKRDHEYLALIDKINEASLSQSISRINKAFRKKVAPELLDQYTISAGSNEARKVGLAAEYFLLQDSMLEKALKQ